MKAAELAPWVVGGVGSIITAWGVWLTGAKLQSDRTKDAEGKDDRLRVDRDSATNIASGFYKSLAETLIKERQDLSQQVSALNDKLDTLRTLVVAMQEELHHERMRREQLEGENRQLKQVTLSMANAATREADL